MASFLPAPSAALLSMIPIRLIHYADLHLMNGRDLRKLWLTEGTVEKL